MTRVDQTIQRVLRVAVVADDSSTRLAGAEHLFAVIAVLKSFAPVISFSKGDDPVEICAMLRATR